MDLSAKKITSGIGIWALITASIALFFASWLAVELALVPSVLMGVVLGLVVWGLFFLVMIVFDATAMASLLGTVVATAVGGFRTAYRGTTSLFKRSPENQVADMAAAATKAIEHELARSSETDRLKHVLDRYVKRLSEPSFTPADVRKEIEKILENAELRSVAIAEGPGAFAIDQTLSEFEVHHGFDAHKRESLRRGISDAINVVKEERESPKSEVDSAIDAALRLTGLERREAQQMRQRLEGYLRQTGSPQLDPDAIKSDISRLISDPSAGREALAARLRSIDRETVTTLLSQRTDLTAEQASRLVDTVMGAVHSVREQAFGDSMDMEHQSERARQLVAERRHELKARMRHYLESLDKPALDYDGLEHDLRQIFGSGDTREGWESLKARLETMDRDTIVEIVSSYPSIDEQQAERIVASIEKARDKSQSRLSQAKLRAERKLKEAKIEARKAAEKSREVAATAAWWAVASAVASGFAAALGGVVAVVTGAY